MKSAVILDRRSQVRKVLVITLGLNLFVMGVKALVGFSTGSLSIQADALHSVTDSANNILGLVSNHLASSRPDRQHPYGHQKFEALGAMGIVGFLAIACFEIIERIVERIFQGSAVVTVSALELGLLLIVLGINLVVAFYERHVSVKVDSPILLADAQHTMSDVWITISVIAGLLGVWLGSLWELPQLQWLDLVLAFPVALLVFRSGSKVLRENLPWLVDAAAIAPELIDDIALQVPGAINCHSIASRGVLGRQVFIEMHLVVDTQDLETAHKIAEAVEAKLEERFRPARILIHVEPPGYQSDQISYESQFS